MADNVSTYRILVRTDGLDEANGTAKDLANNLSRANTAMRGARGGSATLAAARGQAASTQENIDYGVQRSVTGSTRASSRDFAQQAQGLGGLVRVYATFAANLFAVSAAFTALQKAAATENMIKGLDQLGAASGRNLGQLAKDLTVVTSGAVSLREAMTTVAQASSAGLNNQQIIDLTTVATKASQALGVNMTDALSRLSRGITKMEPELLDEVGIFVRVDDAVRKYALSVGKTATSLSEFERRQAFANAVLDQGKKKFDEIAVDTNPYDKLAASMSNIATAGLTLVNNVLAPIVKLLAESPNALSTVFAGIAYMLLKQALPALTQWREGLVKTAQESAANAKVISSSFQEFKIGRDLEKVSKKFAPIKKEVAANISTIQEMLGDMWTPKSRALTMATMTDNIDAAKLKKSLDRELANREEALKKSKELAAADNTANASRIAWYTKSQQLQEADIARLKTISKLATETAAKQKLIGDAIEQTGDKPGLEERFRSMVAQRSERRAVSSGILANVGTETQLKGVSGAFKTLFDNIKNGIPIVDSATNKVTGFTKGLTGLTAATTAIKGSFLIVGTSISTALEALGPYIALIGLLIAAYQMFDSWASKAAKQQEEFNTKTGESASSVEAATRTFDLYIKKKSEAFSLDSITAFANSISQVAEALEDQLIALDKFDRAAQGYDRFKDAVAGLFGKSNLDIAKKSASEAVGSILESLSVSSSDTSSTSILSNLLKISPEDLKNAKAVEKAISDLSKADLSNLAKQLKLIADQEQFTTNASRAFAESLGTISKLGDQIIQTNAFTDLQGKLGVELVAASDKFADALKDPLKALADIEKLSKDPKALAILNATNIEDLVKSQKFIKDIGNAQTELAKATDELNKAKADLQAAYTGALDNSDTAVNDARNIVDAQATALEKAKSNLAKLKTEAAAFASAQVGLVNQLATEGFKRIELGLKRAREMADISVSRAALGVAASAGLDTSSQEYQLKVKEIEIQKSLIDASYKLQVATMENSEQLQMLTALQEKAYAEAVMAKGDKATLAEKALAEKMLTASDRILSVLTAKRELKSGTSAGELRQTFGENAVTQAQASMKSDSVVDLQRQSALAQLNANIRIAQIDRETKLIEYQNKLAKDRLDIEKQSIAARGEYLSTTAQLSSIATKQQLDAKEAQQRDALRVDLETKQLDLAKSRAAIQRALDMGTTSTTSKSFLEQAQLLDSKGAELRTEQQLKTLGLEITSIRERSAAALATINQESALAAQIANSNAAVEESRIANIQKELDLRNQLGQFSESEEARQRTTLELRSQALRFAQEERDLAAKAAISREAAEAAKKTRKSVESANIIGMGPVDTVAVAQAKAAEEAADKQEAADNKALANARVRNAETVTSINLLAKLSQQLIAQKEHIASINDLTTSLSNVFGNVGDSLGSMVTAMDSFATSSERAAEAQAELAKKIGEANSKGDKEEVLALEKELGKQRAKSQLTEVNGIANIAKSTKNLFGQKTAAFKAFAALEKAMHIQSLVMNAQKMASDIATLPSKVASGVAELFKQGGWFGFVGAGVFLALMARLGFGGGKTVTGMAMPTGEQKNEVAGTGMEWQRKDGQWVKEETGFGVFGDPTAKSKAIQASLTVLEENSIAGMPIFNNMVDHLRNIDRGINKAAVSIYANRSLRRGDAFASLNVEQYGKDNIALDPMASLVGGDVAKASNTLSNLVLKSMGPLGGKLGNLVSKINNTLFGGKVSSRVTDYGLQLGGGSLASMAQGGSISSFADVEFKKSGGWFRKTKVWTEQIVKPLSETDSAIAESFQDIFSNATDYIYELGDQLGLAEADVFRKLSETQIKAVQLSLQGLSGEDLVKELNAVIGNILNQATVGVFGELVDKYKSIGEDALTTVTRVIDTNNKINQQLVNMGVRSVEQLLTQAGGMTAYQVKVASIEVTQNIAEMMGGIEAFAEATNSYAKNFMTEAERLAPIQKAVTDALNQMGYSGIDTRDKFKALVQSLNLLDPADVDRFNKLMMIQEAFAAIYPISAAAQAKALTAEEFRLRLLSDEVELLKMQGNVYQALILTRNEELAQLALYPAEQAKVLIANKKLMYALQDQTAKDNQLVSVIKAEVAVTSNQVRKQLALTMQRKLELRALDDRMRPGQEYIYALNDEAEIIGKLTQARDKEKSALESTLAALDAYIDNLKKYKTSLLGGTASVLTPQQKYQESKKELDALVSTVMTNPTTDAEKAAQKAAMDQLSGAADTFLQNSQQLFASSDRYVNDFSSVLDILDRAQGLVVSQKTDAQMQLDQLMSSTAFLDSINNNTQTTAQILQEYYTQQSVVNSAAMAYYNNLAEQTASITSAITAAVSAGSVVGTVENNTNTNQLVADAIQTSTLTQVSNNMQVVITNLTTQIAELKTELTALRNDQVAQTNAMLSNNTANTRTLVNTIESTSTETTNTLAYTARTAVTVV